MMHGNSTFIKFFDFYGKQFGLYTHGYTRYKTNFGGITGIISILIILTISSYFVYDTFLFTNVTVTNYLDEIKRPSNNLNDVPILFWFGDTAGHIIPPEGLYNFELTYYEYSLESNSDKRIANLKEPIWNMIYVKKKISKDMNIILQISRFQIFIVFPPTNTI
jgi:hypothetical protein